MISTLACNLSAKQRGFSLIEAMVTLFLVAVIGMGSVRLLGSSALAQRDMNVLGSAVGQMRTLIQQDGCGKALAGGQAPTLKIGDQTVKANCSAKSVAIIVSSPSMIADGGSDVEISVDIPSVTAESTELFGGEIVVNSTN